MQHWKVIEALPENKWKNKIKYQVPWVIYEALLRCALKDLPSEAAEFEVQNPFPCFTTLGSFMFSRSAVICEYLMESPRTT